MSKGYGEWSLNHIHPVGQDGFKRHEEITAEERLERSDEIYLQSHPLCETVFYYRFSETTFIAKAAEKHYCKCGNASLAARIKLRKIISNYANIRG